MHGINFGGWFSQCDHTEKRYDNFIKKEDFERVARWGFDHVRIPVDYELILDSDLSFKETGFSRINNCIEWCREYGINMVLDLHKTPGYSFDDGEAEDCFFESEKYQKIFYGIWEEFSKRYGHYDNLCFELLNEVSDPSVNDKWNEISYEAIRTIRKHSRNIDILVGGYYNNSIQAIRDLALPYDEHIVYNFHCYSPLIFTHQGAYWIDSMDTSFRMNYESSMSDYLRFTEANISIGMCDIILSENEHMSATYFEKFFAEALKICEERNVRLYCGEYGVIDRCDRNSTLRWYEDICSVFDKYEIGRAAWTYKEMDFGLVDAHYDGIREKLIELM